MSWKIEIKMFRVIRPLFMDRPHRWPGICIIFIQSLEMLHLANAKWATAKLIPVINDMLPF